jgi:hypothetical protein
VLPESDSDVYKGFTALQVSAAESVIATIAKSLSAGIMVNIAGDSRRQLDRFVFGPGESALACAAS